MLNQQGPLPKITCMMVTAPGRLEYLKLSYRCYCEQIYPNRQLLVVNDGPPEYQDEIREIMKDRDDVRFIFLKDQAYTLGGLRNIGMTLCDGDIFVQWDDDDFNLPERLAVQYSFLAKKPQARACFLSDQLHYFFHTHQLYWVNWAESSGGYKKYQLIPGTIMCWTKGLKYRYPSGGPYCRAAEDSVLTTAMVEEDEDQVQLLANHGYMQAYSYHGKNVWDLPHHEHIINVRSQPIKEILAFKDRIWGALKYFKFHNVVQVMGRDGLAFTYRE